MRTIEKYFGRPALDFRAPIGYSLSGSKELETQSATADSPHHERAWSRRRHRFVPERTPFGNGGTHIRMCEAAARATQVRPPNSPHREVLDGRSGVTIRRAEQKNCESKVVTFDSRTWASLLGQAHGDALELVAPYRSP